MAGQKHHVHAPQSAEAQGIGGGPEGGVHHQLLHHLQAFHGIEATATENAETGEAEVGAGGGARHGVGKGGGTVLPKRRSALALRNHAAFGAKPILERFAKHP
jgi:hypothetical protein